MLGDSNSSITIGSADKFADQFVVDNGTIIVPKITIFAISLAVGLEGRMQATIDSGGGPGVGIMEGAESAGGAHGGSSGTRESNPPGSPYDSYTAPSMPGSMGSNITAASMFFLFIN